MKRFAVLVLIAGIMAGGWLGPSPVLGETGDASVGLSCGPAGRQPAIAVPPQVGSDEDPLNDGAATLTVLGGQLPGRPTSLAFGPDGTLYVAVTYNDSYPLEFYSGLYGSIYQIAGDEARLLIDGLHHPSGLLFVGDDLYVSQLGEILRISGVRGTSCAAISRVVTNLPFDDTHQTNEMAFHDGRIYVSQGFVYQPVPTSRLDLRGTVFSMRPDGSDLRVEVTGLRNTYGLAFDAAGHLWGADNGPNAGYDPTITTESQVYPDELNLLVPGQDYGFHPEAPAAGTVATPVATPAATPAASPVPGVCMTSACGTPPVATLDLHTGSSGVAWDGTHRQLLIALSTWGQIRAYDPATTQMTTLFWNLAVPTGIAVGPDGELYVAEWAANRVVRIALPNVETTS